MELTYLGSNIDIKTKHPHIFCHVCRSPAVYPIVCRICRKTSCSFCDNAACSGCSETQTQFVDGAGDIGATISKLIVKCNKCQWIGNRGDYLLHTRVCPQEYHECINGCGAWTSVDNLDSHLDICPRFQTFLRNMVDESLEKPDIEDEIQIVSIGSSILPTPISGLAMLDVVYLNPAKLKPIGELQVFTRGQEEKIMLRPGFNLIVLVAGGGGAGCGGSAFNVGGKPGRIEKYVVYSPVKIRPVSARIGKGGAGGRGGKIVVANDAKTTTVNLAWQGFDENHMEYRYHTTPQIYAIPPTTLPEKGESTTLRVSGWKLKATPGTNSHHDTQARETVDWLRAIYPEIKMGVNGDNGESELQPNPGGGGAGMVVHGYGTCGYPGVSYGPYQAAHGGTGFGAGGGGGVARLIKWTGDDSDMPGWRQILAYDGGYGANGCILIGSIINA